ncbi:hypothetical protein CDAR_566791 [Caerostris darwini]|uniref:Uncharacterized protein n=1 Tax=Caerostris darwini TaxID=1538125 RepID=A0AAV4UDM1_9ARAC|nr:hypothetical protein CDAR_566791 [Caerostris darwini]
MNLRSPLAFPGEQMASILEQKSSFRVSQRSEKVKAESCNDFGRKQWNLFCRHQLLIKCFCFSGGSLSTGVFHLACQPSPRFRGGVSAQCFSCQGFSH